MAEGSDRGFAQPVWACPAWLTADERWAWEAIAQGAPADFLNQPGAGETPPPQLSAAFVRALLSHVRTTTPTRPLIEIRAAAFPEELDLWGEDVGVELRLDGCRFEGPVRLVATRFGRSVSFEHSQFLNGLEFDGANVAGAVSLRSAKIARVLSLAEAKVGAAVLLAGATVEGSVSAPVLTARSLAFDDARITGDLWCPAAQIAQGVQADNLTVGGHLTFDGASLGYGVTLARAAIGRTLRAYGARIEGVFDLTDARLGMGLAAETAEIRGMAFLRGVASEAPIVFAAARFADGLDISGISLNAVFDLSESAIAGDLTLADPALTPPAWGPKASLVLRHASARALRCAAGGLSRPEARLKSHPQHGDVVPTDLQGFRFDHFAAPLPGAPDDVAALPARSLAAWVESTPQPHGVLRPGPYAMIARALDRAGRARTASALRQALGRHRAKARSAPVLARWSAGLSGLVTNHGETPAKAIIWLAALWCMGAGGLVLLGAPVGAACLAALAALAPVLGLPTSGFEGLGVGATGLRIGLSMAALLVWGYFLAALWSIARRR